MPPPDDEADVLDTGAAGGMAIRGGALRTAAYGLTLLLGLVSVPLMTRHLGVVDYGYYVTVTAIAFIIGGFTEAGLTNLGIREYSALDGEERTRYLRAIAGLRFVLTTAGVLVATGFASVTGRPGVVVAGTAVAGVGLLLGLVQQTYAIPLSARLRFGWLSVIDVLKQVVLVGFIVGCVVAGTSLEPFFFANVASGATALALTLWLVRSNGGVLRPAADLHRWRAILREIVPYALAAVAGLIYFRLGVILLGAVGTDEEVGIYSTAFRVIEVVSALPFVAVSAAFPILARAARDDADRLRYGIQRLFDASVVLGLLLVVGLVVGARFAIEVIAPIDEFAASVPVLQLQAIAVVFTFFVATFSFALLSLQRYRALLLANLVAVTVAAVGTPLLAPPLGARGAAIATTLAEASLAVAYAVALWRVDRSLVPRLGTVARALPAAGLGLAAIALPLPPVVESAIAGAVFLVVCLLLRAVPPEVLVALRRQDPDSLRPMPAVDVLIPTYEQAAVVEATVRSALEQDHDDLRVVVSDDGSTDGTADVLRDLARDAGDRLQLVLNPVNGGIPVNFNRLVAAVRGDLVAWLGGDDVMLAGKVRSQVALLAEHPGAAGAMHDAEIVDAADGRHLGRFSTRYNGAAGLRAGGAAVFLDPFYMTLPSTLMLRRHAAVHRYDERLRYANDWLWTVEAFTRGPCVVDDAVRVLYRQTGSNVTAAPGAALLGFEESMMAMALVAARHPQLAGRARAVRAALLLGQARREQRTRDALRYVPAAVGEAGAVGGARLVAWGARAAWRRRR